MTSVESVALSGPHALRAFARAFAHFENFDRFVQALEAAFPRATGWNDLRVVLDRGFLGAAERFERHHLALPLTTEQGTLGTLQVASGADRRLFGAEDLHLLAGLADFLAAVLTQAQRVQDASRSRELLRLLLNQAPVGIAAYGFDRRPIVANELAVRWLGATPLPFDEIEAGGDSFYLRTEGKLVYGEVRKVTEVTGGAWMVLMHDLTPEQSRLFDGLQRELYRARAEGRPCSVVLLEVADVKHGALRQLPALRSVLRAGELAGPYDATRVAVVIGGQGLELRARLRALRPMLHDTTGVRLGYAELGRDGAAPEELLKVALQRYGAFETLLQPALLIHGEHPSVAASLALVLGRDFRIVQSESEARTRELLAAQPFEGLVTELETAAPVVQLARELQPGIQPLYTTVQPAAQVQAEPGALVIEKPFDVAAVVAQVRDRILGA